uniref:Uncharacterized protein n=1 Tax=Romanomermis culicivorax TaxID=13658 RepID=A0A915HE86_ROMCU
MNRTSGAARYRAVKHDGALRLAPKQIYTVVLHLLFLHFCNFLYQKPAARSSRIAQTADEIRYHSDAFLYFSYFDEPYYIL